MAQVSHLTVSGIIEEPHHYSPQRSQVNQENWVLGTNKKAESVCYSSPNDDT